MLVHNETEFQESMAGVGLEEVNGMIDNPLDGHPYGWNLGKTNVFLRKVFSRRTYTLF